MPAALPENLSIAYSPCPNDTFVFHALVHGLVPDAPEFAVTFADIDITNTWAQEPDAPDVLKISYAALPLMREKYELLPCGGALGRGCGPLLLTRGGDEAEPTSPTGLTGAVIGVPSLLSTAYRLFELWAEKNIPGDVEIRVMPFHEIMPAVAAGDIDAGLVIHEARFTYQNFGLACRADLGEWWESETGLPIPLGAIIARKSLGEPALAELTALIRASVDHAWADPAASQDYVMEHAQEMDPEVARSHIALYVNEFTRDLGADGHAAIKALLAQASTPSRAA
jgi:1,4-dihydroxy-6-naphthoate synthase